jgi:hypothetical protein
VAQGGDDVGVAHVEKQRARERSMKMTQATGDMREPFSQKKNKGKKYAFFIGP